MYGDVFDQLERDEVRYVVIGGVAVCLHGHVRPVADLDIVIDPAPDEADRALRALARSGFVPSIPLPLSMLSVLRMFDRSLREVDVNVRYHIPFDDLWAGSQRVRVGDSVARVTSLDHLLRAKRITARPHDLLDVEGLLQRAVPLAMASTSLYGGQDLPMLDKLTIESFEPHVGTSFWLHAENRKIELRLSRAAQVMESEAARLTRTPFSLFFLAPILLPQQIYRLTHEAFPEPLDIFLVPIGRDASGVTHEAVFT